MSRIARAGALLGTGVALTAALSGVAHAAPAPKTQADCYVIVYSGKNFTGHRACISGSGNFAGVAWPGTRSSMDNSVRSIKMDKACTVTLYQNPYFRGKHTTWKKLKPRPGSGWQKDGNLSNNAVGDKKASSIKRTCSFDT
ncbi:peptidase inhibitor family I36 protein [Actinoallomurus sp. NPDC050550]|uniref:peptidase inhibitor family I36 protein n=1 Tax=Actinoallomurus sp. NPDC050550 TaxID=3154937 RepID=UPI0033E833E9